MFGRETQTRSRERAAVVHSRRLVFSTWSGIGTYTPKTSCNAGCTTHTHGGRSRHRISNALKPYQEAPRQAQFSRAARVGGRSVYTVDCWLYTSPPLFFMLLLACKFYVARAVYDYVARASLLGSVPRLCAARRAHGSRVSRGRVAAVGRRRRRAAGGLGRGPPRPSLCEVVRLQCAPHA